MKATLPKSKKATPKKGGRKGKKYVGFKKGPKKGPGTAPIDVNALAPGARANTNV